jgi:hypothetical protein
MEEFVEALRAGGGMGLADDDPDYCPDCGSPDIDRDPGQRDHDAITVHPDRDNYDSRIGTRGGYAQVALCCTRGHAFNLILANHKGAEYVAVVKDEDRPGPSDEWADTWPSEGS